MSSIKPETASQTAGPYVHIGCTPTLAGVQNFYKEDLGSNPIQGSVDGREITIKGKVYDGDGVPLLDSVIEIWQADNNGKFNSKIETSTEKNSSFSGWARRASDMETGEFSFKTIKPGPVPFDKSQLQAPHITFWIVARGINKGLHTRMYFADEDEANKTDPLLTSIEDSDRISTLFAVPTNTDEYQFDIYLQGPKETIFFDI